MVKCRLPNRRVGICTRYGGSGDHQRYEVGHVAAEDARVHTRQEHHCIRPSHAQLGPAKLLPEVSKITRTQLDLLSHKKGMQAHGSKVNVIALSFMTPLFIDNWIPMQVQKLLLVGHDQRLCPIPCNGISTMTLKETAAGRTPGPSRLVSK